MERSQDAVDTWKYGDMLIRTLRTHSQRVNEGALTKNCIVVCFAELIAKHSCAVVIIYRLFFHYYLNQSKNAYHTHDSNEPYSY